jgi:hypothetical protein
VRTCVALPLGLVTLGLLSCASTSPQAPKVLTPEVAAAQNIPPAHVPWVQMNKGQRIDYMVKTVLPRMKKEFQAFDGKRFARMDCGTCHGDSVEEGTFALPNPKLPKLLEPDLFAKHRAATPEITKFMLEKVEPKMAELLEIPDFDPATRKGMSCYNCHPREIEPGKPVPPPADHH